MRPAFILALQVLHSGEITAVDRQAGAGDEGGLGTGEIRGEAGNLAVLTQTAKRHQRLKALMIVLIGVDLAPLK